MNSNTFDRECTNQCKSTIHGDIITDAISKRSISDTDLCSFLNYICSRCETVFDSSGRTALHVAVSCGRLNLVRWLVRNRHADINIKDRESGYTALHRSIFYGKLDIAVELIKLGANLSDTDLDYLTPLEHSMKDGLKPEAGINGGELYSWGSNNNNLLGPQQSKHSPDLLDSFHKKHPGEYVKHICISQFHSVLITISGKAFTCGHGQGGRLGLGDEQSAISPQPITFNGPQKGEAITCIHASISRDHSVFLCSDGNIYTCGINKYHVLGQVPAPDQSLTPKPVKQISKEIQGVCASQYHSVAWGPNALYTWGLNAGQLGIKVGDKIKSQFIIGPKSVNMEMFVSSGGNAFVKDVASSNGAIAVCTSDGDIYVLHEYLCRKIASRQLNIVQISIIGGNLDSSLLDREVAKEINTELKVAALTNTGNVSLWQGSDQKLCRCIYSINRAIVMKQISMRLNELLLVSEDGEAFKGFIKPRKKKATTGGSGLTKTPNPPEKNSKKSPFHVFLDKEDCVVVSLQKIGKIHRAVSIDSDLKGRDFCVIQAPPFKNYVFPDIEKSQLKENFTQLYQEIDEQDTIHDITFKVEGKNFPAHKYIVAKSSHYLANLMGNQDKLTLTNVNPDIFRQILLYFYTGECELTKCGVLKNEALKKLCHVIEKEDNINIDDVIEDEDTSSISAYEFYNKQSKNRENKSITKNLKNPVRILHELAKKFEISSLQKILAHLEMDKYQIYDKNKTSNRPVSKLTFDRSDLPQFYDVTVKCRDNKTLNAHKCVLAARLEYFNSMFMRWNGENITEVSLPFPKATSEALLDHLYTDTFVKLNSLDTDHLFNVLILADQLFVTRLKEQCECLLSDLLTLKNAVQILSFAYIYTAEKLKYCCMKFITANITPLLESKALDELEDDLLKEMSDFYFQEKEAIQCRVITPYSTAEKDEIIESIATAYPVSLTDEVEVTPVKPVQKKRHRQHRNSEKSNSISISDNDSSFDSFIQFPDEQEPSIPEINDMPARLRSIHLANRVVREESVLEDYYPMLGSSGSPTFPFSNRLSPNKQDGRVKIVKISQKQRKRLASESKTIESPPTPVTPKNPWKIIPETSSPITTAESNNISYIISDEKRQKEKLFKLTTRPLMYTQIEDKAIDELHKFYNTENVMEELIIIERVNIGAIAAPVWVQK